MLLDLGLIAAMAEGAALGTAARALVLGSYRVPTSSMAPAIQPGDRLVGERITLHGHMPSQGSVVTFRDPRNARSTLVKRVIATEGHIVDIRDGRVLVDGTPLDEPYVQGRRTNAPTASPTGPDGPVRYPYVVPKGHLWVMGDNRGSSRDSRVFGPIPLQAVSSRVVAVVWPRSHARRLV
jgi:signal peptidase I